MKAGQLPLFPSSVNTTQTPEKTFHSSQHPPLSSGYTFTDLAQLVCKVPRNQFLDSGKCQHFLPSSSALFDVKSQSVSTLCIVLDSSDSEEYEEDGHEVGYASEPSAGILDVST